jgi:hypothetical protein
MSAVIQFVAPAEVFFPPASKKSLSANREPRPIRLHSIGEPKQRFWQLSARANSTQFAMIEWFVLVLFLVVALIGLVSCFGELAHLLDSDAIGHVAAKAIGAIG